MKYIITILLTAILVVLWRILKAMQQPREGILLAFSAPRSKTSAGNDIKPWSIDFDDQSFRFTVDP